MSAGDEFDRLSDRVEHYNKVVADAIADVYMHIDRVEERWATKMDDSEARYMRALEKQYDLLMGRLNRIDSAVTDFAKLTSQLTERTWWIRLIAIAVIAALVATGWSVISGNGRGRPWGEPQSTPKAWNFDKGGLK